jgi:DNA repair photolyase
VTREVKVFFALEQDEDSDPPVRAESIWAMPTDTSDEYTLSNTPFMVRTAMSVALLNECNHPFTIVTKNAMVERDLDIQVPMAERDLVQVFISINSLVNKLASKLEPRARTRRDECYWRKPRYHCRIRALRS